MTAGRATPRDKTGNGHANLIRFRRAFQCQEIRKRFARLIPDKTSLAARAAARISL